MISSLSTILSSFLLLHPNQIQVSALTPKGKALFGDSYYGDVIGDSNEGKTLLGEDGHDHSGYYYKYGDVFGDSTDGKKPFGEDGYDAYGYKFEDNKEQQESDIQASLWAELGQDKIGDENSLTRNSGAGYSIASNAAGNIIAIGAPDHNSYNGQKSGMVSVYRFNDNAKEWLKIGYDLYGVADNDRFGYSVALSTTGLYLAVGIPYCTVDNKKEVGCVKVYERDNTVGNDENDLMFEPIGLVLVGEDAGDNFGWAVDIHLKSDDENFDNIQVAVGAPNARNGDNQKVGKVYFYHYDLENKSDAGWRQSTNNDHGGNFVGMGKTLGSKFGSAISLTLDDQVIAVGAPGYKKGSGSVSLFKLEYKDGNDIWSEIGGFVVEGEQGDHCGASVSITLRGDYIAYGCPTATVTKNGSGALLVEVGKAEVQKLEYQQNATDQTWSWTNELVVDILVGQSEGDHFGSSIDIGIHEEAEASTNKFENLFLAVGAPDNYPNFDTKQKAGHVQVYHLKDGSEWYKAGLDIDGDEAFDALGTSVAIAYDGKRVAVGAPGGEGYAKVFQLSDTRAPTFAPSPIPSPKPTDKQKIRGSGSSNGGRHTLRSFFLFIFYLLIIPGSIFMVFRTYVYWKARRDYSGTNAFRPAGDDMGIGQPVPNNDLELAVTTSGGNPSARDII